MPPQALAGAQVPPKVLPSHQVNPGRPGFTAPATSLATPAPTPVAVSTVSSTTETLPDLGSSIPSAPLPPAPSNEVDNTAPDSDQNPPQRKSNKGKIIGALAVLLLVIGGAVSAYFLTQDSQDIRNQAVYYDNGEALESGLSVTLAGKPDQSHESYYKPASADVNDASRYYDQGAGQAVEFTMPVRHERGKNNIDGPITDRFKLQAYRIDKAIINGQEVTIDENSAYSESQIYDIHKQNDFTGTVQSLRHDSDWQSFTVQPDEQKMISGYWKPGSNDCGMYQIDMLIESGVRDKVLAVGMIRIKNCKTETPPPQTVNLSGAMYCLDGANKYPVTDASGFLAGELSQGDKVDANGIFNLTNLEKGKQINVRAQWPATISFTKNGATQTVPFSSVTVQTNPADSNCTVKSTTTSYEGCTVDDSTATTKFDFALLGCIATAPTPKTCNESCTPGVDTCSGSGMVCQNISEGVNKCRLQAHPTQENCQAPNTPTAAPMCLSISVLDTGENPIPASRYASLSPGSQVIFSCGRIAGVTQYRYRVIPLDASGKPFMENAVELTPTTGINSTPYTVPQSGSFAAQCTICVDDKCFPYESGSREGATGPTPTPTPDPRVQTACPQDGTLMCRPSAECDISNVDLINLSNGTLVNKYTCSEQGKTCCGPKETSSLPACPVDSGAGACVVPLSGRPDCPTGYTLADTQYSCVGRAATSRCCMKN